MTNPRIICTVTNDLIQDQRMHRICNSLVGMNYDVILVGRKKSTSLTLQTSTYRQVRLHCFFERGIFFYLEYNLRILIFLLLNIGPNGVIYSVDTDTLLAGAIVKRLKKYKQIFDAHEYFTQAPELENKTCVKWVWSKIENICIPNADAHITVSEPLARLFSKKFQVQFDTLYNVPVYSIAEYATSKHGMPILIYLGMLNKGRGLEQMIAAMEYIEDVELWIIGDGDITSELVSLANSTNCSDRIKFKGWKTASEIKSLLSQATLGLNLLDRKSESYYYSLANKFFDYMHTALPSVNMDFPAYREVISKYEVGIMLKDLKIQSIATQITSLLRDNSKLLFMRSECLRATVEYQWQREEQKLKDILKKI